MGLGLLNRLLLARRLRARGSVAEFVRAFVKFYAVGCSCAELHELEAIDDDSVTCLGRAIQEYLAVTGRVPTIRVVCLGTSAKPGKLPWAIRRFTCGWEASTAFWISEARLAIIPLHLFASARPIVFHEVTHGLVDVLSGGFPYPFAVTEGFAALAEIFAPRDLLGGAWELRVAAWGPGTKRVSSQGLMSIRDLLFFDWRQAWEQGVGSTGKTSVLSAWMMFYLASLSSGKSILAAILPELRRWRIKNPGAVYACMLYRTGLTEERLERGFRRYCTGEE